MSVNITAIRSDGARIEKKDVDGAFLFNGETHGDVGKLLERSDDLDTDNKVVFINSAMVDVVIYEPNE